MPICTYYKLNSSCSMRYTNAMQQETHLLIYIRHKLNYNSREEIKKAQVTL